MDAETRAEPWVLVVEDDESIRVGLSEILASEGYRVTEAENGKVALDSIDQGQCPDLVLLDLFMPVMSGNEFVEQMKGRHPHLLATLPVVVLTAAPEGSDAVKQVRSAAAAVIKKPASLDDILQTIGEQLAARPHAGSVLPR